MKTMRNVITTFIVFFNGNEIEIKKRYYQTIYGKKKYTDVSKFRKKKRA